MTYISRRATRILLLPSLSFSPLDDKELSSITADGNGDILNFSNRDNLCHTKGVPLLFMAPFRFCSAFFPFFFFLASNNKGFSVK